MPWRDCCCTLFSSSVLHQAWLCTPFWIVHSLDCYLLGRSLCWPSMLVSMFWDLSWPMFTVLWQHCFLYRMSSWYSWWCILMYSCNQKLVCLTLHRSTILQLLSFYWRACLIAGGSSSHLFFLCILLLSKGCHVHSFWFYRKYRYF